MKYTIKTKDILDINDVVYYGSPNNGNVVVEDENGKYTEEQISEHILNLSNGFIDANSGYSNLL